MTLPPAAPAVPITIGSDPACGLAMSGAGLDAVHAELFCDGEHWCLRDRASDTGTYLDENRLFISAIRLEVGHRARFGSGEGAAAFEVIAGADAVRAGVDVTTEVAGFVKEQKRARKKLVRRWAIALPSTGLALILGLWTVGGFAVLRDRADRRAHPERYNHEGDSSTDKLAAIMAGEARPEDVDVKEIIAAASFGRTSKLVDVALGTVRGTGTTPTAPVQESRAAVAASNSAHAIDENSLAALIDARRLARPQEQALLDAQIISESRLITLRRLRNLIDDRHHLRVLADTNALPKPGQAALAEVDQRLSKLGIDTANLHYQPGDDVDKLEKQLDPAALERVRMRLVEAMSVQP